MRNRPAKKNSYRHAALCGLAMGTAIGTSLAITQRMTGHHRMPNLKTWRRALIAKHGEVQGAFLAARVQARYETLCNEREAVLSEVGSLLALGSVFRAFNTSVKLHMFPLKLHMPPLPFALFQRGVRVALLAYPREGWSIDQIEQSDKSIAFTIHRCFYLDVLTAYGAPELTAMFCRLDDLAYAALPPAIRWERTKTLGRGDDCCDFRWSRVEKGQGTTGLIQVQPRVKRGNVSSHSK